MTFKVGDRVRSKNEYDLMVNPQGRIGIVTSLRDWGPAVLLDGDSSVGQYFEDELELVRKYSKNEINEIIMLLYAHCISDTGMDKAADMLEELLNVTDH